MAALVSIQHYYIYLKSTDKLGPVIKPDACEVVVPFYVFNSIFSVVLGCLINGRLVKQTARQGDC